MDTYDFFVRFVPVAYSAFIIGAWVYILIRDTDVWDALSVSLAATLTPVVVWFTFMALNFGGFYSLPAHGYTAIRIAMLVGAIIGTRGTFRYLRHRFGRRPVSATP